MRWDGLKLLRENLGDKNIGFKQHGGYELFSEKKRFSDCQESVFYLNKKTREYIGKKTFIPNQIQL